MALKLITPSDIPTAVMSRCLIFPDSTEWRAIINGLLGNAIDEINWQQIDGITPAEAAEKCQEILLSFFEAEECHVPYIYAGEIRFFGMQDAPPGWLVCDGSVISRATYAELFTAIGDSFGIGDGTTTFAIPDMEGRSPMMFGDPTGITAYETMVLGSKSGIQKHTLSIAEMPSHNHALERIGGASAGVSGYALTNLQNQVQFRQTLNTGGSGAHQTIHPVTIGMFAIYTGVII